jgi:hypothetical protein
MANVNSKVVLDQDLKLIAGVQKRLAKQSFIVSDKSCTAQDVIDVFQGRANATQAVFTARAALATARKAERDTRTATAAFASGFRCLLRGMYQDPSTLADFGLSPRKSTKKTLDTKVAAVEKTKATRKARGTMGIKQKKKIKGMVPAATSGASTTPATSTKA